MPLEAADCERGVCEASAADALFGIHALRSAPLLLASGRPFVLILGGTDVTGAVCDVDNLMRRCIASAAFVVAFSDPMAALAKQRWPEELAGGDSGDRLCVIPPASTVCRREACLAQQEGCQKASLNGAWPSEELSRSIDGPVRRFFLLPSALRSVKDPLFIVDDFVAWANAERVAGAVDVPLLIIAGPTRDNSFASDALARLKALASNDVRYVGVVPYDVLCALEHASEIVAVLNTSTAEGLANSLIEAATFGVPRIARNVVGNCDIIQHEHTGYLFDSADQCVEQMRALWNTPEIAKPIIATAYRHIIDCFSAENERKQYCQLFRRATQKL